jgi:hypothetical protein
MFASLATMAHLAIGREPSAREAFMTFWKAAGAATKVSLILVVLGSVWALYIWMFHGISVHILGVQIRSHDWRRPALLAVAALGLFMHVHGGIRSRARQLAANSWFVSCALGSLAGGLVFLWIYLGAYREHPTFPEDQLMSSFIPRHPSRWRSPSDVLHDLGAYDTLRPFTFVFALAVLSWIPHFTIDRRIRHFWLWLAVVSLFVLLISVRFNDFALWRFLLLDRLPGLSAIRDPKRMVYVYELALVLVSGAYLTRLPAKSVPRIAVSVVLLLLLVTARNRETFEFLRPVEVYDRWVAAPIDIDASCKSFFIKRGSDEYMSRSEHMWSLYAVDSMFVALNHSLPTLNGYSAWGPEGWSMANPQEHGYSDALASWIARHNLHEVCEFDIDRRTITPHIAASSASSKLFFIPSRLLP